MWSQTTRAARLALPAAALALSACEGSLAPPVTGPGPYATSAPRTTVGDEPAEERSEDTLSSVSDAAPEPVSTIRAEPDPQPETEPKAELASKDIPGWTTFRHSLGTAFQHPADWRVQETAMGLMLSPPDLDPNGEMIAGFGSSAQGVTDPLDPQVAQTLDMMVQQTMPMLQRSGRPRAVEMREGKGAAFDYGGRSFDGTEVRCRVFVAIAQDTAVGFSVLGSSANFERRAPIVEKIFTTLHDGRKTVAQGADQGEAAAPAGDIDPRLVGVFRGEAISSSSGVYVNTQLVYAFNGDGTVLYGAQSHMSASQRDYNGNLKWTADGTSDGSVDKGRWSARDGFLTVRWDGGNVGRYAYGFEPDGTLALRNPVTRKLINIYYPAR